MAWVVELTCCGRADGSYRCETWDEADAFRNQYCYEGPQKDPHGYSGSGFSGHQRSGRIHEWGDVEDWQNELRRG